ncbi:MAG TPA: HPF/RaiA family ribosome-associated protein [Phycisphaerae bacterium]|nr:HPF/RaiA family ribosome-associated protein [Phycisphaerae bacterium]HRW52242.1 HPF/RaiA family ribosome-associated protein [Phycisphaerae bacterium]
MQIQVNTDNHIKGDERLSRYVERTITDSLKRFDKQLTRVEIHFHDDNSSRKSSPDDIRCVIEARPRGLKPVTVSDNAESIDQAFGGAIDKIERALERTMGKLEAR